MVALDMLLCLLVYRGNEIEESLQRVEVGTSLLLRNARAFSVTSNVLEYLEHHDNIVTCFIKGVVGDQGLTVWQT